MEINKLSDVYCFWKNAIDVNAPINIDINLINDIKKVLNINHNINLKYPYKPFLILAILLLYEKNSFNNEIKIELNLIKKFYDFCTFDDLLFEIFANQKAKSNWYLGFNEKLSKKVKQIMIENPISKLANSKGNHNYFIFDKQNKTIYLNIKSKNFDLDLQILKYLCYQTIKKCIFWFKNLSLTEFINENETIKMNDYVIIPDFKNETVVRKRQHIFRKEVLDRDQKCLVCCTQNNSLLNACHIKPYKVCNPFESYDENNGITLCYNHHKLFDVGFFTLIQNGIVKISKKLDQYDAALFFKQFEPCFSNSFKKFSISTFKNEYWTYHQKYVFDQKN